MPTDEGATVVRYTLFQMPATEWDACVIGDTCVGMGGGGGAMEPVAGPHLAAPFEKVRATVGPVAPLPIDCVLL